MCDCDILDGIKDEVEGKINTMIHGVIEKAIEARSAEIMALIESKIDIDKAIKKVITEKSIASMMESAILNEINKIAYSAMKRASTKIQIHITEQMLSIEARAMHCKDIDKLEKAKSILKKEE